MCIIWKKKIINLNLILGCFRFDTFKNLDSGSQYLLRLELVYYLDKIYNPMYDSTKCVPNVEIFFIGLNTFKYEQKSASGFKFSINSRVTLP